MLSPIRAIRWALVLGAFALLTPGATLADDSATDSSAADSARVAVGQEAPAFTLTSSQQNDHTLSELRGEKNLLLVFFRGAW